MHTIVRTNRRAAPGTPSRSPESHCRYSPSPCVGAKRKAIIDKPDMSKVGTSHAERMNLNIRMGLRRFTRLTNAFSKKMETHCHALAIYFMHYNFCRIRQTTRVTPAMAAGISDKLWELIDVAKMADDWERDLMQAADK